MAPEEKKKPMILDLLSAFPSNVVVFVRNNNRLKNVHTFLKSKSISSAAMSPLQDEPLKLGGGGVQKIFLFDLRCLTVNIFIACFFFFVFNKLSLFPAARRQ